nr:MAG TPA: hypothetical protein [Caudoviricetes sp.]
MQSFLFGNNRSICTGIYVVVECLFRNAIDRPDITTPNSPVG